MLRTSNDLAWNIIVRQLFCPLLIKRDVCLGCAYALPSADKLYLMVAVNYALPSEDKLYVWLLEPHQLA